MSTRRYYIVWNEGFSEGFVTSSYEDAKQCAEGRFGPGFYSTVGEAFYDSYEDQDRTIEVAELPDLSDPTEPQE